MIRLAGVPFDAIASLGTPESIRLTRKLGERQAECAEAADALNLAYQSGERLVSTEANHALRVAVRAHRAPGLAADAEPALVSRYASAAKQVEETERALELELEREVNVTRASLVEWSRRFLPRYLVFASPGVRDSLLRDLDDYPVEKSDFPSRRSSNRKTEQTLLLYLQRVAAKNDTFSEFGPGGWGTLVNDGQPITFDPKPEIARREVFFERWVADAIAEAITSDPDVPDELIPRLDPNSRISADGGVVNFRTGQSIPLSPEQLAVIQRCDGKTPLHALADQQDVARDLIRSGVLRSVMEVPALEPHAFEILLADVGEWRDGTARERWQSRLQPLAEHREKFADTEPPAQRIEMLDSARSHLESFCGARRPAQRFLYSAQNVIGEECFRECNLRFNQSLVDEVATEAAPWIDLWRDSYSFIASRVAAGLGRIFEKSSGGQAAMPMPLFLRACEEAKLPLTGPGLVALAVMAFQEVKAVVRECLMPHAEEEEYQLTAADAQVVRQKFDYPRFDEYTYPSADLQLAAESVEAVADGRYQWIVSELHPSVALLHHGVYWSCPDKQLLSEALARCTAGKATFHFGFFAADFTSHTAMRALDALPQSSYFVAPQRANSNWQTIRPADAEVFVDGETGDVCLRAAGSHQYLGSFARNWVIPLGFHPFQFSLGSHTPRLRCGRTVVQRQSWTVTREDLPGEYQGISRGLLMALDQLRSRKNLPRYVYIRPTEQALRRSGAEGRDKDTKPIFVDLESYLFHEIFYRWLVKAGEVEVTEMLPTPEQLLWQEADGRHTFEMRTQLVPRS